MTLVYNPITPNRGSSKLHSYRKLFIELHSVAYVTDAWIIYPAFFLIDHLKFEFLLLFSMWTFHNLIMTLNMQKKEVRFILEFLKEAFWVLFSFYFSGGCTDNDAPLYVSPHELFDLCFVFKKIYELSFRIE